MKAMALDFDELALEDSGSEDPGLELEFDPVE